MSSPFNMLLLLSDCQYFNQTSLCTHFQHLRDKLHIVHLSHLKGHALNLKSNVSHANILVELVLSFKGHEKNVMSIDCYNLSPHVMELVSSGVIETKQ